MLVNVLMYGEGAVLRELYWLIFIVSSCPSLPFQIK